VCGRRFGKTTLAILKLVHNALNSTDGRFFYVAPTYSQAKMIAWGMLYKIFRQLPKELQVKKNESELYVEIRDVNGTGTSRVELKGADNPDSLRGVKLNGAILDEYADMKENVYQEIIRPALTDLRGWCWFVGTPKGFNHFHDVYKFALEPSNEDWSAFKCTTYDNPYIPKEDIDLAGIELNEDFFSQEYMADFKKFTGLVYKDFDRTTHIVDNIDVSLFTKYRSIDFGTTNPFVCLWIAVDGDDNWFIYDEHYQPGWSLKQHAEVITSKSMGEEYMATYRDPSAKLLDIELPEFQIYPQAANNAVNPKDVEIGISKIQSQLKINPSTTQPKLFVFRHCENTIREFETYSWQPNKVDTNNLNVPIKKDDHAMDCVRYFSNTYIRNVVPDGFNQWKQEVTKHQGNKFTGY